MKDEERTDSHPKPDNASKVTTATSYGGESKRNCVILQTLDLMKPGKCSIPFRILFDKGSQQSYVTENLYSKLTLKPVEHEKLSLNIESGRMQDAKV